MPFGFQQRGKLSPPDSRVYSVMAADPPWPFDMSTSSDSSKFRGTTATQYETPLTVEQIIARDGFSFHWPIMDDESVLFLWRVGALAEEAYAVMRAWGFIPKSEVVWRKTTKTGKRWIGMGRTVRWEHETCYIGVRGSSALVVHDNSVRSVYDAPVPVYEEDHPKIGQPKLDEDGNPRFNKRGEPMVIEVGDYIHSAKPESFYRDVVMKMCAGPYVELFARPLWNGWSRPGWRCYGNELPGGMA